MDLNNDKQWHYKEYFISELDSSIWSKKNWFKPLISNEIAFLAAASVYSCDIATNSARCL
jgi:hypothetical protein